MDGEIILRKKELPAKAFRKLQVEKHISNEFYTLDIESININSRQHPYLINAYDGIQHINSYGNNEEELFKSFITKLLEKIELGSQTYIYAHNFSTYDGILLLKHLFQFGKVSPLLHNGKLMSIKLVVREGNKTKTLIFKDSYLMLTSSLRNLCNAFKVKSIKSYFPYNLNNIYYSGIFPEFKYWTDITNKEWSNLKQNYGKRMWSFELEAIKYCKLDCEALHQVLTSYN